MLNGGGAESPVTEIKTKSTIITIEIRIFLIISFSLFFLCGAQHTRRHNARIQPLHNSSFANDYFYVYFWRFGGVAVRGKRFRGRVAMKKVYHLRHLRADRREFNTYLIRKIQLKLVK